MADTNLPWCAAPLSPPLSPQITFRNLLHLLRTCDDSTLRGKGKGEGGCPCTDMCVQFNTQSVHRLCNGHTSNGRTPFPSSALLSRVEKYRPGKLEDLISHGDILATSSFVPTVLSHPHAQSASQCWSAPSTPCCRVPSTSCSLVASRTPTHPPTHPPTVQRFIDEDRLPHLLLYGPPGTGKTSTIKVSLRRC